MKQQTNGTLLEIARILLEAEIEACRKEVMEAWFGAGTLEDFLKEKGESGVVSLKAAVNEMKKDIQRNKRGAKWNR